MSSRGERGGGTRGARGRRQRREKVCTSGRDGKRLGVSVFRLQGREQVPSAERANALLPQEGRWWWWWWGRWWWWGCSST